MFLTTVSPEKAPDKPTYVEVDFVNGEPVKIDGKTMSPAKIVIISTRWAVRTASEVDMVENRFVGMKSGRLWNPIVQSSTLLTGL